MTPQEKVQRICEILKTLGEEGSASQLAHILAVCPTTVVRYINGTINPRSGARESIDVLYRVLQGAHEGNNQAQQILEAVLGQSGLIRMGLGGVLIAGGMAWLVKDRAEKPHVSSADGPATTNSTEPSKASRKRQRARKPT